MKCAPEVQKTPAGWVNKPSVARANHSLVWTRQPPSVSARDGERSSPAGGDRSHRWLGFTSVKVLEEAEWRWWAHAKSGPLPQTDGLSSPVLRSEGPRPLNYSAGHAGSKKLLL